MARVKRIAMAGLVLGWLAMSSAWAETASFKPAELSKDVKARYPSDQFSDANERSVDDGLIELLFMVDENGNTAHPIVLRASMEKFKEPALRALEKYEFNPAMQAGAPVQSAQTHTVSFMLQAADLRSNRGSSSSFTGVRERGVPEGYQSHYDEFAAELAEPEPDRDLLASLLDRMIILKHQSFYSLAYHSLARFRYAERYQGAPEKMAALRDLIWYDQHVKERYQILQDELQGVIWSNLLKLEIEAGHYAEALQTYAKVEKISPELSAPFAPYIDQINGLKESDQFTQRELLFENEQLVIPLLKRSFTFIDASQPLESVALYCSARYADLGYQPDAQYQIPADWGECRVALSAESGTTVKLLEQ